MKEQNVRNTMYQTNEAVAAINQVKGFNPLQYLRRTYSEATKQEVWKLDLRYQKLWFRLAHPMGRIRMKTLRITDQLAIIEARIFLDRSDPEPVSSFIAECTAANTPGGLYIQAAQYESQAQALTDAGFGLQFSDISHAPGDEAYGSELPVAKAALPEMTAPAPATNTVTAEAAPHVPAEETAQSAMDAEPARSLPAEEPAQAVLPAESVSEVQAVTTPVETPAKADTVQESTLPAEDTAAGQVIQPVTETAVAETTETESKTAETLPDEETAEGATTPTYTKDMPVEEIMQLMTYEEACDYHVDFGTCKGWTMQQVAERRTPSLRWYVYGYTGEDNAVRAAASIMMESMGLQKAG